MIIALGADHRGFALKEFLKKEYTCSDVKIMWNDVGAYDDARSDYPVFARAAIQELKGDKADCAILLCATGIGMAIVANRFAGIYAGVAWNPEIARAAKEDDNMNVLVLPCDMITHVQAAAIVDAWIQAKFKEGRYQKRISMIDQVDRS
jgi:ribose 5-phosphate isomerase B